MIHVSICHNHAAKYVLFVAHICDVQVSGVSMEKSRKKWVAMVWSNGKQKKLGRFTDIEDAADAVKAFRCKHGYTERHGEER